MGGIYEGVDGVRREMAECPVGIGGVKREVTEIYTGVGGVRRLVWQRPQDSGGSVTLYANGENWWDYYTTVTILHDVQEETADGYEFHITWTGEREDYIMSVMEGEWFYSPDHGYYGKVIGTYDMYVIFLTCYE